MAPEPSDAPAEGDAAAGELTIVARPRSLAAAAERLAALLTGGGRGLADPAAEAGRIGIIEFVDTVDLRPLKRRVAPDDVWAVDGGQALIADARCLQVVAARSARVRFQGGRCTREDSGEPLVALLGGEAQRVDVVAGLPMVPPDCAVDLALLRDVVEWQAVRRCLDDADPGAMVLVDGDLQPDWRIPSRLLAGVLDAAAAADITVVAVTKHSSLSRGGAPLLGALEREAGDLPLWWAPVGRVRSDVGDVQVVAARLDPQARFAFRVDLPPAVDPEAALGRLSAICDDAAFPGYPYPLSVADRLAAVPGWLRSELRFELDELLARAAVPDDVRERAFADRHRLMERA